MSPAEPRRPVWRLPVGFLNQVGATRIEDIRDDHSRASKACHSLQRISPSLKASSTTLKI